MDLEEDGILDKVAKASGANFSFHKEKPRAMPEQGPVVSQGELTIILCYFSHSLSLSLFLSLLPLPSRVQFIRRLTQDLISMPVLGTSFGLSKR